MIEKLIVESAGGDTWAWTAVGEGQIKDRGISQFPNISAFLRYAASRLDKKDPVDAAFDLLRRRGALCDDVTPAMLKLAVAAALEAAKAAE